MYDVIIIGAGPAGISAGIYAVSRGQKALILEKNQVGGLIRRVSAVTHLSLIHIPQTLNYGFTPDFLLCTEWKK